MLFSNITLAVAALGLGARAASLPHTLSPIKGPAQPVFPPNPNPIKGPAQPVQLSARGIPTIDTSVLTNNPALNQEALAWANSTMAMCKKVLAAGDGTTSAKRDLEKRLDIGKAILNALDGAATALGAFPTSDL